MKQSLPRLLIYSLFAVIFGFGILRFVPGVYADECENPSGLSDVSQIQLCISKIQGTYDAIAKANSANKETLSALQRQISGLQASIKGVEKNISDKEKLIVVQEKAFAQQYQRLAATARSYYIRSRREFGLGIVLGGQDVRRSISAMGLLSAVTRRDKEIISGITETIRDLEGQKSDLAAQKTKLQSVKATVDEKASFYAAEVSKASAYEQTLSGKISALSARQNEILAAKTGVFQTTVGDVPLEGDPNSLPNYDPGFRPAFAAFSFGAPHYRGMSQYGALGRAKGGQGYEEILKAYYGNVRVENVETGFSLKTSAGAMHFEDRYIMGIAEMPSRWGSEGGMEALKAQAIAARSYALSYTGWRMGNRNAGGTICVTETCQVWSSSKANNPGEWRTAVEATRGKVLVSNNSNEIVNSWYASTSGGYQESYSSLGHTTPGFWDTPRGREGWTSEAYENKAGSPWFYKGWYKDRSGVSCGRNHPWLTEDEFSDILNAWKVRYNGSGDEVSRVTPTDTACWGGSPYSISELRNVASKYGGGYLKVTSVSVSYSTEGVTANLTFATDKGSVSISGVEFKTAFNLRAPGRISIKSGLYNIEKK
jgi:peptidoglycan hydrolase-like amidase